MRILNSYNWISFVLLLVVFQPTFGQDLLDNAEVKSPIYKGNNQERKADADEEERRKLIPAPTNRNFALVAAPLGGISIPSVGGFGYTAQFSGHFYKPAFALDFYYEAALQDLMREKLVDEDEYLLVEHFFNRMEANFALTYSSKVGRKNSLFYSGTEYYGGSAYDLYSSGSGDAAKYRQLRFGLTKFELFIPSEGLDSFPTKSEFGITYEYNPNELLLLNKNLNAHFGFGFTKVYKTESPSRRQGIDRIGMRKMYFDFIYNVSNDYLFLKEDGNAEYHGYLVPHVKQRIGGRIGWEVIRLNPFSGYYQIEFGIFPGIYAYDAKVQKGTYLIYGTFRFGLSTGWPLFNRNYE